ncbi:MAG TPA: CoA transferase [Thermodesulfobacteriota bacterium]|nr:CoA transferase [Thermodesulfobacteriota bacterium]
MNQPLSGVRILDLSQLLAGPYGSMILADLGAEVIKIEKPGEGEIGRGMPPHFFHGESVYFISINRNKKSMTLDLKAPEGLEVFYRLVGVSDVVYDNFRPGTLEKLRIDYESLRKINPRIISCSISGYGQTGPFKDSPAFDLIIQARGGIMSYTGEPGQMPVRMGAPMGDLAGGMFAVQAVEAALYQREKTGQGQRIDLSLLDCQIALLIYRGLYYLYGGEIAQPVGSGHVSAIPIRAFKTKTFDIVIDANTDKFFQELCGAMGLQELLSDPRFPSRPYRLKNKEALYKILEETFLKKTGEEWLKLLEGRVPVGPINTVDMALNDPQILSRNMVVEATHRTGEKMKLLGTPIKMSQAEEREFTPPPALGEHTDQVLADLLKFSPKEVQRLREKKIV